jgi:hypothetical protein
MCDTHLVPWSTDFHHIDASSKEHGLGTSKWSNKKLAATMAEADKCAMLCRNCHTLEHHVQVYGTSFFDTPGIEVKLIYNSTKEPTNVL